MHSYVLFTIEDINPCQLGGFGKIRLEYNHKVSTHSYDTVRISTGQIGLILKSVMRDLVGGLYGLMMSPKSPDLAPDSALTCVLLSDIHFKYNLKM